VRRTALLLLFFCGAALAADFRTGLDAYNRGDYAAAAHEWQPLADSGDPHAQYNLGLLYARGLGVDQNYERAIAFYRLAASQGVAAAQYNLGVIYANGQGVAVNRQEAAKWFLQAAEQGIVMAASGLGRMYDEGEGAFHNPAEAIKWYKQAAQQGVASAAFSLGVMYDLGQGVPKDYPEAIKWYKQAADAGYAPAMVNLGILYYNAQGVKRDLVQSYAWFTRGQSRGDPHAADLLAAVTGKLKPRDLKKAKLTVDQWQPQPVTAVADSDSKLFKPRPASDVQAASAAERAATEPATQPAAGQTPSPTPPPIAPAAQAPPSPVARPDNQVVQNNQVVQDTWSGVDRVIAIGDVHGDYEQFVTVLASAGLIDGAGNWTGGATHLVQTGDVLDRGPDSRAVMDLLMRLEKQAAAAGGGVHCLIGNHEAMNIYGDLRFVSPGEFASYAPGAASATRPVSYDDYKGGLTDNAQPADPSSLPDASQFPGFAERRAAFAPDGVYGRWIRSLNSVIKIDRTLFVHAGIGPKLANWQIGAINSAVRQELSDLPRLHGGVTIDPDGPQWYRDLAAGDEQQLQPLVDTLLKNFDVDRIVVGHTYADAAITPRFDGKVILIDIGISRVYDNIGKVGCLEIDQGQPYALHRGQKLALPRDEDGPDMLRYLREASALDPPPSPLERRIEDLTKNR
jgi:TPR repeat protein